MIAQAREWIYEAKAVAVLTGAGISAESGVPTFRGPGGLWRDFRPEELATPDAFARDPKLVWEWYLWRRARIKKAKPNRGHLSLVDLEKQKKLFWLVTQNVDGLHDLAGSQCIIKVHGDIWTMRCEDCVREVRDTRIRIKTLPPRCPCGGRMRPAVVWFGESLPQDKWEAACQAVNRADLFMVLGTSALVYPAASLPEMALRRGIRVIEINSEMTQFSAVVPISLRGKTGELLPLLVPRIK